MSLVLELPPELETELSDEATRLGMTLSDYALQLLTEGVKPFPPPQNGHELLSYWKKEGLIGTKPEIQDPAEHARELRENAQSRNHS